MQIYLNNNAHEVSEAISVRQLLDELKLDADRGIALAVNGIVISRNSWAEHKLSKEDKILLIKASQGG